MPISLDEFSFTLPIDFDKYDVKLSATEKKELKVVLGYSNINSNRVVFVVDKAYAGDVKPISFSAKYLKEILTANKEATAVVLKVSTQGISHVEFKIDDFTAKYFLVEQQLTA
jgi:hypothetical protein